MTVYGLDGGGEVSPGDVIARAGEGTIYEVVGHPEWVAKVFHAGPEVGVKRDKVVGMIASPPAGAVQGDGFVVLTWPVHVLAGADATVGYVMPRVDTSDAVEIHKVSNPSDRLAPLPGAPQWTRHVSWAHLVNIAANLCLAVDAVHHVDAVIGDFQERNILVNDTTRVTLVDCDSMQFTDGSGRQFLCGVGRPEFTAPELAGVNLSVTAREQPSDLFALAVHIHLLLMAGNHPFLRGEWTGGDQPDALSLAKSGFWAGGPSSPLRTHPLAPPVSFLPESVQRLFVRAFTDGARDPSARPSAAEWRNALQAIQVTDCVRGHQVPVETDACPWCAVDDERTTRRTAKAQTQTILRTTPPRGAPPQSPHRIPPPPSPYVNAGSGGSGSGKTIAIVAAIAVAAALIIAVIVSTAGQSNSPSASSMTTSTYSYAPSTALPAVARSGPPSDAVECGPAVGGNYGHAARGSDLTSCPFSLNVRDAVNASSQRFPATLQVYSPVTHQNYAMSCVAEQVLTCRGGNNAIVYVY
jgi:DNA-binding helix-hairpin-helix protein with protein kinase domain